MVNSVQAQTHGVGYTTAVNSLPDVLTKVVDASQPPEDVTHKTMKTARETDRGIAPVLKAKRNGRRADMSKANERSSTLRLDWNKIILNDDEELCRKTILPGNETGVQEVVPKS